MPWSIDQSNGRATRLQHTAVTPAGAGAINSDALDVLGSQSMSVQVVWAGHGDTSTWEMQSSNDGTNFDQITGTSTTTAGASGAETLVISPIAFRQIRLTVTETDGGAAPTLTIFVVLNHVRS